MLQKIRDVLRATVRTVEPETAVIIVLNAIIPLGSLIWSLWGSFGFWSDVFGSPIMALGAMFVIESVAMIGFVLYVADWAPGSWLRWSRHCLPIIPLFQLTHSIHAVAAAAPFSREVAIWTGWTLDVASWTISGAFAALFAVISFGSWEAFGSSLRDRHAWKLRRIDRNRERARQAVEAAKVERDAAREIAQWEEEFRVMTEIQTLLDEYQRLQADIPLTRARLESQYARMSAIYSAIQMVESAVPSDSPIAAELLAIRSRNAPSPAISDAVDSASHRRENASGKDNAPEFLPWNGDPSSLPEHVRRACAARLLLSGASQYAAAAKLGLPRTTLQSELNRVGGDPKSLLDKYLVRCTPDELALCERIVQPFLSSHARSSVQTHNGMPAPSA